MPEIKILVLDGDAKNRASTYELLSQKGFTVSAFSTDEDITPRLAESSSDLILINPCEDANEISKRLKETAATSDIPLLQIANPSANEDRHEVEGYADGFLLAPVEPVELVMNIKALVRLFRSRPQESGVRSQESRVESQDAETIIQPSDVRNVANRSAIETPDSRLLTPDSRLLLQESEAQLRLVVEAANVGTWDWHFADDYSHWGGKHAQLFGLPEETPGVTLDEFLAMVHSEDRQPVEQATFRAVHEGADYNVEYRILHPDGGIRWMHDQGHIYHDADSRAVRLMGIVQDITERKQFEVQLRDSAEQLRLTTTGVDVGLWFWNLQTDELLWTETCKALFGLPPEAAVSYQVFLDALHPDDRERTDAAVRLALEAGSDYKIEYRTVWSDNSVHWISARGYVVYDNAGKPLKMTGVAWDITRRKETEFALQASEERYRALVQASSQIVWSMDERAQGQGAAEWWMQLTGMDEEASRGWGWLDALHPDDRERAKTAWQQALETYGELQTEYRVRDAQGSYHYLSVRGVPIWNEDKSFREWVGTITDITDRKRDELALRESNAILTAINQSTEDLIFVKDLQGRFLLINPAFALLLGKAEAEIIGKLDWELLDRAEVERARESDMRVLYSGKTEVVEETLTLMKGARTYLSTKSPYLDETGAIIGLICISTDITHRKRAEKEREQLLKSEQAAREEAQAANRAKDEFLAIVSHELRTPLNAMLGWTRILQAKEIDEATQTRALETIERSARMQAQIIEDLLDTARIISGKLRLEVRSVRLLPVINAALEIMRPAAAAKQLEITVQSNVESDLITGDAERLQQVIWNLLSNAIKFNLTGGKVTITLQRVDPYMQIVVRDTGKGIAADLLPFIFDRFYQADSSSKRRVGGLGLGLALVRQLVELHGGAITAESEGGGKGATFIVNLPIRAVRARTATMQSPFAAVARNGETPASLEGVWALVVDDEADARDLLTVLLQRYGAKVTASASAAEALAIITEGEDGKRPDIIISDIGMPEQDGYTFMRQVRNLAPHYGGMIPAIAVTAFGQPSDRLRALTAGFQSHIPKPVDMDELRMVIANLTGRANRSFTAVDD